MSWAPEDRAAALGRLAGLVERQVPWGTGLELLAEEHGAARLEAARRAQAEGQGPGTVLERAGLVQAWERQALDRQAGGLASALRELSSHAADEAAVRGALRETLTWPAVRLVALAVVAGAVWAVRAWLLERHLGGVGALGVLLPLGVSLLVAAPPLTLWGLWRVGLGRGLLERLARWLPLLGRVVRLAVAARFWRAVAHGLRLGQPLPAVLRATRDAFPPRSYAAQEVAVVLPAALEGEDLPSVIARLDNPDLREEHLLRIGQARGSLADDVLALAELRREQLLDVARGEGALLLVLADTSLALTAGVLVGVNLFSAASGGVGSVLSGLTF